MLHARSRMMKREALALNIDLDGGLGRMGQQAFMR